MAAHRRANVQVLRRLAQKHGVARVSDDANRDKVKKMAKAVLEAVENAHFCDRCDPSVKITNVKVVVWPQPNAHFCDRCDPFVKITNGSQM